MTWFENHLYVGTTRANLVLLNFIKWNDTGLAIWPVEVPYKNHSPEFEYRQARAEIWRYDPRTEEWERLYQAPIVINQETGREMSREVGYRGMVVFRGASDTKPTLYVSNYARRGGGGLIILRSEDGKTFEATPKIPVEASTVRLLVPFKGRLFTAPTGKPANPNMSGVTLIFETRDPAKGLWEPANESGFGDPNNLTVFEMRGFAGYLYAGTANVSGYQIWRTRAEGKPPYQWELVLDNGAGRGKLNQIATSMMVFRNSLYIGSGIQGGGFDQVNMVGPAGGEVIRINRDGSWDLIMGDARDGRKPLSGLSAGFGNICNGYIWRMGIHQGWLYVGTMEWSIFVRYASYEKIPEKAARMLDKIGLETVVENQGGVEIWRTRDGELWMPVTLQGFGNCYNFGIRNIVSTPHGVFIGTANPFGPKVALQKDGEWVYVDNPLGGLEVWHGR